jgi:hypothetical protein
MNSKANLLSLSLFQPAEFFPSRIQKPHQSIEPQKVVSKHSEIDPGCSPRIPNSDPDFLPIPDPGVKKAPDPGSGSATLGDP